MSIFKYGFILWGFFVCYTAIFVAYVAWMIKKNKEDTLSDAARGQGGR
ncbi:MAG: hypothetical protein ACM3WT_05360 [Bacillota bacterium]